MSYCGSIGLPHKLNVLLLLFKKSSYFLHSSNNLIKLCAQGVPPSNG